MGDPDFWRHMVGSGNAEEVIDRTKNALDAIKQKRSQDYMNTSQGWKSSQAQLDLMPTINKFLSDLQTFSPSGKTPIYMQAPLKDIGDTIRHWGGSGKTMADFDYLKRDLDKLYNSQNFRGNSEAQAVLTGVRDQVWQTIVDHDPVYADIMGDYEKATKEINNIVSDIGTNRASTATRLNKLIKASGKETGRRLAEEAPDLPSMIAGQELSPFMPGGIRPALISAAYGIPAYLAHPAFAVGTAMSVPRIAGAIEAALGQQEHYLCR
jgi:hypothetical protein